MVPATNWRGIAVMTICHEERSISTELIETRNVSKTRLHTILERALYKVEHVSFGASAARVVSKKNCVT